MIYHLEILLIFVMDDEYLIKINPDKKLLFNLLRLTYCQTFIATTFLAQRNLYNSLCKTNLHPLLLIDVLVTQFCN